MCKQIFNINEYTFHNFHTIIHYLVQASSDCFVYVSYAIREIIKAGTLSSRVKLEICFWLWYKTISIIVTASSNVHNGNAYMSPFNTFFHIMFFVFRLLCQMGNYNFIFPHQRNLCSTHGFLKFYKWFDTFKYNYYQKNKFESRFAW